MKDTNDMPLALKQEARIARLEQSLEELSERVQDMLNRLAEVELSSMGDGFSYDNIDTDF